MSKYHTSEASTSTPSTSGTSRWNRLLGWAPWLVVAVIAGALILAPISGEAQIYSANHIDLSPHQLLNQSEPVLLSFTSASCGACRVMSYQLEDYGAQDDAVAVLRLDVDAYRELAQRYQIRALPTQVLVQQGQALARNEGIKGNSSLTEWINTTLSN